MANNLETNSQGRGNALAVQWLGLHGFIAKGLVSIPRWGTKIPQAMPFGSKKLKKKKKNF